MIITDQFLLIHGLENEKQDLTTPQARETYYYKKLNYLKEHCDKHTLLIIDNFDAEDERTQELLEGPYSVIFTTRISREKDGYQELSIHPMDNPEDLIALFQKFYKRPLQSGDDMILLQILIRLPVTPTASNFWPDKCKPPECPLPVCWTFSMEKKLLPPDVLT